MKNAVIMAALAYHAAMCENRIPRKKRTDRKDRL